MVLISNHWNEVPSHVPKLQGVTEASSIILFVTPSECRQASVPGIWRHSRLVMFNPSPHVAEHSLFQGDHTPTNVLLLLLSWRTSLMVLLNIILTRTSFDHAANSLWICLKLTFGVFNIYIVDWADYTPSLWSYTTGGRTLWPRGIFDHWKKM